MALLCAACGKQGPPLPPLHLVPEPVSEVSVRRTGDEVRFTFTVPTRNLNAPGPVNIERVELFGATVAPGATPPTNRQLMSAEHLVGSVAVGAPPDTGTGTPAAAPQEPKPGPGERASVVDVLDASKLTPQYTTPLLAAPVPAAPAAATPAAPAVPVRIYTIRGVARGGRPGQPIGRVEIPLVDPPPPPTGVAATFSETAITVTWTAPEIETPPALAFNVYAPDATVPLHPKPLTDLAFVRQGVEFGREECFVVRSARAAGPATVESTPSVPGCVTPMDIFPPAAPQRLSAVPGTGMISLIWDANTEKDLAGYLVLRGEVPGEKLQALTASPIKETTFRDTTVKPGVRYVYVIVAVDTATPANTSAQSNRVEETAR